ncbi:hypothetical protein [Sphingomonas cavernae]|uniref:Sugar transporter n=1 Tax=Sphingomonas cavernae TaxID=2320861 RepID=A0A418WNV5_9SPHN|nr:hypothetical protein [Sphingomonas cavernae]RJF92900.1 hypothetical protein D3876_00465 [Sphingomonas cavernae]
MADAVQVKVPTWFWVVAVLALLWELMGVAAYVSDVTMTQADLAALPEGQRQLYATMPPWVTAAYAIAVFGGALGAMALLMRRNWARMLFIISMIAVICQFGWSFGIARAHEIVGANALLFPALIVLIAIALVWFSGMSTRRGWLR